ncbi:MAG: ATP-binding protein [Gammaproteobacteria bacterium]
MKELTIMSGKGGTGKTTVCAAFASLAGNKVLTDCDVDAANLHLLLEPEVLHDEVFIGGRTPIDPALCIKGGDCQEACRFDAIEKESNGDYVIDPLACENCGLCAHVCPVEAIHMVDAINGHWFISRTPFGTLVHARLDPGEDNSGKLVTLVRRQARRIAEEENASLIINDGPPGIGCPVTAATTGVDAALIVTEPTLAGVHDMERVVGLCRHFDIPALVCINKYDINPANSQSIRDYCRERSIPVVGEIPFERKVNQALVARKSVLDFDCGSVSATVTRMWENTRERLDLR